MQSTDILLILNLIILESILSIDNAAVLATMVKHLPQQQQSKALKYGIWGAFIFRGVCLFVASWLVKLVWLKMLGGWYLLWISVAHFTKKEDSLEEIKASPFKGFWGTVLMVELVDIVFSIDNVFAAVAITPKFWVIITGVCIGIVAMRFAATGFLILIRKYPSLNHSAFIVIGILGLKLILEGSNFILQAQWIDNMRGHTFDLIFSACMIAIFFVPIILHHKVKYHENTQRSTKLGK